MDAARWVSLVPGHYHPPGTAGSVGLVGLVQTVYAYFAVHTSDWQLPEAPLSLTLGPQNCGPATPRSHQLGRRAACTPDSEPGRVNCSAEARTQTTQAAASLI